MATPTGVVRTIDGAPNLVLTRTFRAPAADVWRSLTESDRLEVWIGRWEGDPTTGQVDFYMTAEAEPGAEIEPEHYVITECDPPRRFAGDTSMSDGAWHLWFELTENDGETTLTFGQRLNPGEDVASIGPGWEYYLDRLAAARAGTPLELVVWDDYFPALSEHYRGQVP